MTSVHHGFHLLVLDVRQHGGVVVIIPPHADVETEVAYVEIERRQYSRVSVVCYVEIAVTFII